MKPAQTRQDRVSPADRTARQRQEDGIGMERLVAEALDALAEAPAEDVIKWATDTFGDRIVRLLRERDYDLGMTPAKIAADLGEDEADVTRELSVLERARRVHPTSFGNWDHGPPLPPLTADDVDQG